MNEAVIDWQEAMDQCGDDEEFLRELLSDLRGEIDAQLVKIDEALKVSLTIGSIVCLLHAMSLTVLLISSTLPR